MGCRAIACGGRVEDRVEDRMEGCEVGRLEFRVVKVFKDFKVLNDPCC